MGIFIETMRVETRKAVVSNAEELVRVISKACTAAMPQVSGGTSKRKQVYWWHEGIKQQRRKCLMARSGYSRALKKEGRENLGKVQREREKYKIEKKTLNTLIQRAKEDKWRQVCEEVQNDTWGLGYQIVMGRLRGQTETISKDLEKEIVSELFLPQEKIEWRPLREEEEVTLFNQEELDRAIAKMKKKKRQEWMA